MTTQQRERAGNATNCKAQVRASVLVLLARCRPSAITRLVMSVGVVALNREANRLYTHVRQKILKAFKPSFAHGYTSSAISVRSLSFFSTSSVAVSGDAVSTGTPARRAPTTQELVRSDNAGFSTVTIAPVSENWATFRGNVSRSFAANFPSSKAGSGDDNLFCRHNDGLNIVVFSSGGQLQLPVAAPYYLQEVITVNS